MEDGRGFRDTPSIASLPSRERRKRLALTGCSKTEYPNPAIRDVYRASRAIDAALENGTLYPEFMASLTAFSRELKLLDDKVSLDPASLPHDAPQIAKRYQALLDIYHDSVVVWSAEMRSDSARGTEVYITINQSPELKEIANKYGVSDAITLDKQYSRVYRIDFGAIRQAAWRRAGQAQSQILPVVFGKLDGTK